MKKIAAAATVVSVALLSAYALHRNSSYHPFPEMKADQPILRDAPGPIRSDGQDATGTGLNPEAVGAEIQNIRDNAGKSSDGNSQPMPTSVANPEGASGQAASASEVIHLTSDQLNGISRVVDYLVRSGDYMPEARTGGRVFSIRGVDNDNPKQMIFLYKTVKPHLVGKPRTYVFTLFCCASEGHPEGDVDSVEVMEGWDENQISQAASDPSKLNQLRQKVLRRENSNSGSQEVSLLTPDIQKLLQEELNFWAQEYKLPAGTAGPAPGDEKLGVIDDNK